MRTDAHVPVEERRQPRVSVVLNSFNQAGYLRSAVDSVLDQTCRDLELIAIDNGSTDGSAEILRSYERDPRVRLMLLHDNQAISRRFNQGVTAAAGEFVSFLYSDDWYLPNKLERQVQEFNRFGTDVGVVYGPGLGENERTGARWQYGSLRSSGYIFRDLMLRFEAGQIDMITPMVRRTCLLQHPFHEDVFAEGEAIFLRIALTHRFAFIDEPLAVMRDRGNNAGKAVQRNRQFVGQILVKLRSDPHLPANLLPLVDRYEGVVLRQYGWQGARLNADTSWVRSCYLDAVRASTREALHPKTAAGLMLVGLPRPMRRRINRIGHAIRRAPSEPNYVEDYEGLASSRDDVA